MDFALEQGKEVFVLPGRITDSLSAGCNRLLRQGAGIVLSPKDIMEEMSRQNKWQIMGVQTTQGTSQSAGATRTGKAAQPEELSERERQVWEKLDSRPQTAQQLYECLSEDLAGAAPGMAELTDILMNLILKGKAGMERGSTYVRKTGLLHPDIGSCKIGIEERR